MKTKITVIALFIIILIPGLTAAYTYNSKEFQHIIKQLDMQGHADHELSTCSVKKVYYEEVVEMLNGGKSEKEIIQSYVDEYGQAALRTPGSGKSGLIAWGMPAAGFAAGIAVVAIWLKKLKGNGHRQSDFKTVKWESDTEKEIAGKLFDEERRKLF
ncbi:cytochrome c-type biogenesis protein CcmH [Bacillus sp. T33-2]|uniref:cytochrome c-type biogenesis protein CcmH n=1 Tax=Bacillus sp. T33-2 TaxID=2054168 RepID=UPI000C77AF05|nr:cytochrome c-type biogenesis protein CcmH [Bacillus sp. T33-2]PLR98214.1 hypothetical protein CVD19_06360 [Bacillus sp. T33-2]